MVSCVNILCHGSISCVHTLVLIVDMYHTRIVCTVEQCTGKSETNPPTGYVHHATNSTLVLGYLLTCYIPCAPTLPPSLPPPLRCIYLPPSSLPSLLLSLISLSFPPPPSLSLSLSPSLSFSPPLSPSPSTYNTESLHTG